MTVSLRSLISFTALSLVLVASHPAASFAQDDADKAPAKSQSKVETDKVEVKEEKEESPAEEKTNVNWVDVESTGTLSSAKEGAMEKTFWKDQKRTDIEFLLGKLPTQIGLRSVLDLQRRVLLSETNSSLISNDIGPLRGNDLLIQRIKKLVDMGLYDDAWSLYTQKAEEPYDVSIAQTGMLLLVMRDDLATACLEEKVFSTKYPKDKFFALLDKACAQTLGATAKPQFTESTVLQSVYNDDAYTVSAASYDTLAGFSDLERALVLANAKIRYDGLTADILAKAPSKIVALYAMDKAIPEAAKKLVVAEMNARGLSWHTAALAKTELVVKAKQLAKDTESLWPVLESALNTIPNSADLAPFMSYLAAAEPKGLSTDVTKKVIAAHLATQTPLSSFWVKQAQAAAAQKPIIYIYLQALKSLTPTSGLDISEEQVLKNLKSLKTPDTEQILAILGTLDKKTEYLNNPLKVYDKHSLLTFTNNYVMPSMGLNMLLDAGLEKKQIGITVLAILNGLAAKPDNMYSGTVSKALKSMLEVGLIEDAKRIGGETIASVLNKY